MFDTHCHLNFSRFKKNYRQVVSDAVANGVFYCMTVGTDITLSKKALGIAGEFENVYASAGIHPHHVYEIKDNPASISETVEELEQLVKNEKVLAVGEIGMDKHIYEKTKYEIYNIDAAFLKLQEDLFRKQVGLAKKFHKSLIIHNREAKAEMLGILAEEWHEEFEKRSVFHCCEPDGELLQFAKNHNMFIGVDGDVTYWQEKQEFIKTVPLQMLVLETDSPFLLPEPLKSQRLYPNEPKNIPIIAAQVAALKNVPPEEVKKITLANSLQLFGLPENE